MGREIRFKTDEGTSVVVKSESMILPGDISADLYVMVNPSLRAEKVSSQSVSSGSDAEETFRKMRGHKN